MKTFFQTKTFAFLLFMIVGAFNSCKKNRSCENCPGSPATGNTNKSPIAVAGPNQTITLPTNSISLDGAASSDPDGNITGWQWTKVSGPVSFAIAAVNNSRTQVNNLAQGTYLFELTVTDNTGLFSKDTVQITVQAPINPSGNNVYIAGYGMSTTNTILKIASISINGIVQELSNGQHNAVAKSVYVYGNDIYVAGFDGGYVGEHAGSAILWKNGMAQNLAPGFENSANSVFVSDGDVYVGGNKGKVATLWKNGVSQNLSDGQHFASANSVFVSGSDVYLAGYENGVAVLWKNGQAQNLGAGDIATAVFVVGNDIYVAGGAGLGGWYPQPVLWKNGVVQPMQLSSEDVGYAHSLFVSGNDVYMGGWGYGNNYGGATILKNGVVQQIGDGGTAANSLFISDNDVYAVTGTTSTYPGNQTGILWKNGVVYITGLSVATSVFVQ